jgi:hypothetical protein
LVLVAICYRGGAGLRTLRFLPAELPDVSSTGAKWILRGRIYLMKEMMQGDLRLADVVNMSMDVWGAGM